MPQAPEIKRLVLHFVCVLNIDQSLRRNKKLQKSEDNILYITQKINKFCPQKILFLDGSLFF